MWSYYGSKSKIINYYPSPKYDMVVEPFAGSARYSLKYFDHDVMLIDMYPVIIGIWEYLQQASKKDILTLPDVGYMEYIRYNETFTTLSKPERDLIGFCINRGSNSPKNASGNFNGWNKDKIRIANDLYKIRHWKVLLGDYKYVNNYKATWFIDPPYQFQHGYVYNDINYNHLSQWCKIRKGQVIVCETVGANWLDFKPLISITNSRNNKKTEMMYYKEE